MDLDDAIRRGLTGARRDDPTTLRDAMRAYGGTRGVAPAARRQPAHRPALAEGHAQAQRRQPAERPRIRAGPERPSRGPAAPSVQPAPPAGRPRIIDFRMSGDAIQRIEDLWYAGDEVGARQAVPRRHYRRLREWRSGQLGHRLHQRMAIRVAAFIVMPTQVRPHHRKAAAPLLEADVAQIGTHQTPLPGSRSRQRHRSTH